MTQIVMIGNHLSSQLASGIVLTPVKNDDTQLLAIARDLFCDANEFFLVAGNDGRSEPLIDDVWEAQRDGRRIEDILFVKLTHQLIGLGIEFACWIGADYRNLPVVSTWERFRAELLVQTKDQPADLYVHYRPAPALGTGSTS